MSKVSLSVFQMQYVPISLERTKPIVLFARNLNSLKCFLPFSAGQLECQKWRKFTYITLAQKKQLH